MTDLDTLRVVESLLGITLQSPEDAGRVLLGFIAKVYPERVDDGSDGPDNLNDAINAMLADQRHQRQELYELLEEQDQLIDQWRTTYQQDLGQALGVSDVTIPAHLNQEQRRQQEKSDRKKSGDTIDDHWSELNSFARKDGYQREYLRWTAYFYRAVTLLNADGKPRTSIADSYQYARGVVGALIRQDCMSDRYLSDLQEKVPDSWPSPTTLAELGFKAVTKAQLTETAEDDAWQNNGSATEQLVQLIQTDSALHEWFESVQGTMELPGDNQTVTPLASHEQLIDLIEDNLDLEQILLFIDSHPDDLNRARDHDGVTPIIATVRYVSGKNYQDSTRRCAVLYHLVSEIPESTKAIALNASDNSGMTALMHTASMSKPLEGALLIHLGADPECKDPNCDSAADYAAKWPSTVPTFQGKDLPSAFEAFFESVKDLEE